MVKAECTFYLFLASTVFYSKLTMGRCSLFVSVAPTLDSNLQQWMYLVYVLAEYPSLPCQFVETKKWGREKACISVTAFLTNSLTVGNSWSQPLLPPRAHAWRKLHWVVEEPALQPRSSDTGNEHLNQAPSVNAIILKYIHISVTHNSAYSIVQHWEFSKNLQQCDQLDTLNSVIGHFSIYSHLFISYPFSSHCKHVWHLSLFRLLTVYKTEEQW